MRPRPTTADQSVTERGSGVETLGVCVPLEVGGGGRVGLGIEEIVTPGVTDCKTGGLLKFGSVLKAKSRCPLADVNPFPKNERPKSCDAGVPAVAFAALSLSATIN